MFKETAVVLILCIVSVTSYSCAKPCYSNMCCSIPSDNLYYLTSFCDESTACGIGCSEVTYFAADSQRFGCRKNLTICSESDRTNCVKVLIIDAGPNISVEREADRAIIDASSAVCQQLFGDSSCGWSDYRSIVATLSLEDDRPYGPFTATLEEVSQMELLTNKYHTQ
eukprot:TRINITY_DN3697_c0_g1_i1.p1 TRINITY_DN3697_c0_g1~~TRINITY_DN3697_c0_g1_i1.p1  ORF type:complete len:182 (-),score=29.37 TRINITY_DN3697_c0_g1_i1:16-519(-)